MSIRKGLSPKEHERIVNAIWQSGGAGRDALREEIVDLCEPIQRPGELSIAPYHSYSGGYHVYGSRDGNVIVSGDSYWNDKGVKIRIFRAWDRLTKTEVWRVYTLQNFYWNNCYNPVSNRIISFVPDRNSGGPPWNAYIEERDATTGIMIRKLWGTTLGAFALADVDQLGGGSGVAYDPDNVDNFWVAQYSKHVVLKLDWYGNVLKQFGVYGVPGNDNTHLNGPNGVSLTQRQSSGALWVAVADQINNRVLILNGDAVTINNMFPFPKPSVSFLMGGRLLAVYNSRNAIPAYGAFILDEQYPIWHYSSNSDCFISHPQIPWRMMVSWSENMMREININRFAPYRSGAPISASLYKTIAATLGTDYPSRPILTWFRRNSTVFIKATQAGTLQIQVPRTLGVEDTWDGTWETYDTAAIVANTLLSYTPAGEMGIYRVSVNLAVNGTIYGWVNLSP